MGQSLVKWHGREDLNPGPADLESAALPTELHPYILGLQYAEVPAPSRDQYPQNQPFGPSRP